MIEHPIFLLLHLVGLILWLGGAACVALIAAGLAGSSEREHAAPLRRVALGVVTPGMLLAWIGGLGMAIPQWADVYSKAGWLHAKIGLALVAAALTGVLTGQLRKAAKGSGALKPGLLRAIAWTVLAIVLLAVSLAVYKPWS